MILNQINFLYSGKTIKIKIYGIVYFKLMQSNLALYIFKLDNLI